MTDFIWYLDRIKSDLLGVFINSALLSIAASALSIIVITKLFRDTIFGLRIPRSHKIAVLGLPKAGKTTLITSMFDLIQIGEAAPNVRLHGSRTMARVARNVALLQAGRVIPPTKESDIFVFRFSYERRVFPVLEIKTAYDVEVADFPGEYSKAISEEFRPNKKINSNKKGLVATELTDSEDDGELAVFDQSLFDQEFFSWIATSSEFIFVIDLASIYGSEDIASTIADQIARIRTSWHIIEESAFERSISRRQKREVHIVYTKIDSLMTAFSDNSFASFVDQSVGMSQNGHSSEPEEHLSARMTVLSAGFPDERLPFLNRDPNVNEIELKILGPISSVNDSMFLDLTKFFRNRVSKVNCYYTSGAIYKRSKQAGSELERLLKNILP